MKQIKRFPGTLALALCNYCTALAFLFSTLAATAQTSVLITELMASNTSTLADEDGAFSDWIEIYNAGASPVNLDGWFLTDSTNAPMKWKFPSTNLAANGYMVVFASNKNRQVPGAPLHTNFKLSSKAGSYLALVKPDGVTVASEYAPSYPIQAANISYGLPVVQTPVTLVSTGAPARFLVPPASSFDTAWTLPDFDDTAWASVNNGIGFETDPAVAFAPVVLADSVAEFSGTQGSNNWFYGYWDKTSDSNGIYEPANDFVLFPRGTGTTLNTTNFWDGTKWDWAAGNPPWTELTRTGGHPSGDDGNSLLTNHWAIRRWVSETNGRLRITGTLACSSQSGTCGDGTIGRILVDGTEVFHRTVFGTSVGYSIIVNASTGSLIDFVIDPGLANNDFCDTTTFTGVIRAAGDSAVVADSFADWSVNGAQGAGGWFYGYWLRTNSTAPYSSAQFVPFPSSTGPQSAANFWDGAQWHWFDGDPPFDTLGQILSRPNLYPAGGTAALEHWVIRRWVSQISGQITIDWHFSKMDLTGEGTIAKVFLNGTLKDTITLSASDFTGTNKTIAPFAVQVGDTIDFTVEPGSSTPSPNSIGDICFLNATISGSTTLSNQFLSDVGAAMRNISASAYLRIPFTVTNVLGIDTLTLRMKYDDGIIVYLNGTPVASRNAPDMPLGGSTATAARLDADASQFEEVGLTLARDLLRTGTNVLAIQGLNSSAGDGDFLAVLELRATILTIDPAARAYFAAPTPGSLNGPGSTALGPLILDVTHTPNEPTDDQDLVVTAQVVRTLNPIGTVQLYYRVMFGSESNVVMLDDGLHGDGLANDGIYGATIPNTISTIGQMVRYYITATDSQTNLMREPPFPNPLYSAQYFGAVVQNPDLHNPLPVLHLFITAANMNGADNDNLARFQCSVYYLGEFYDNVGINRHGQSSSGFPQKSYDVDFDPDHHFLWDPNGPRVSDINLLTTYPDKAHMRNMLSHETYRDAGSPYHWAIPIRVQTNGGFFGDWHLVENGGNDFLKRIGRDPNGALYKMYVTFTTPTDANLGVNVNAEKKTRKFEGNADLVALYNGVNGGTLATRTNYMYDNLDIAEMLNMLAARSLTSDWDCCHKNYYFYRDSDNTGEWQAFPWDVDLAFGRNWSSSETYWDDRVYPQNRIWGNWDNNGCFQVVLNMPAGRGIDATHQMYLRRCRTLFDELQQPNGTPADQLRYEKRIDELAALIAPDAALDLAKWGSWGGGNVNIFSTTSPYWRTLPQSVAEMKTNYFPLRRKFIFDQFMGLSGIDLINFTNAQPTNVVLLFGGLDYNPSSGNQAEEYLQLINTNRIAVDISGWTVSGAAMQHTFQGGVVIPSSNSVYVVADKKTFRGRLTPPRAGMGLYLEGSYKGQLSAQGDTLQLIDKTGRVVASTNYLGNPSLAQRYLRITELMYHPPPPPAGSPYGPEDFEYIELKNIGLVTLDLNGVHFTNGIDFSFTGSSVTTLGATQTVLIVKNLAAFTSRYGSGFNIAGQYGGSLNNGGEKIEVDDAVADVILVFSFDNNWYPLTDGSGDSLVIQDENALWSTWGGQASWRQSAHDGGSPGVIDPPPVVVEPILVNEVLSHSIPPLLDAIELYNPNLHDVNIGGWFISDDLQNPKKFRIRDGFMIQGGGYAVFYETNFNPNPGVPPSFAFSSQGDQAYLFSGDANTNLTGYFHGYQFGAADEGVSFGRYLDSAGAEHFVAQQNTSLGSANGRPLVGPVVISEINYHPPNIIVNNVGYANTADEFIELQNITSSPVALYDTNGVYSSISGSYADGRTNTWHLRDAVHYEFPTNVVMPVGGFLMVVGFDPLADGAATAAFRARNFVPDAMPIYGPWRQGQSLNDLTASVELVKPGEPTTNDVPQILVDRVNYSHAAPWPVGGDGFGLSLQRVVVSDFGDDATNWVAVAPSPGANYVAGGIPPVITSQPSDRLVVLGADVLLSASATGTAPVRYQWRFNNGNIYGANSSTLLLTNFGISPFSQVGPYSVFVYNSGGSAIGTNFTLTSRVALKITSQPVNRIATNGGTTNFTVSAVGTGTLRYQWRFNGGNILNATNATPTNAGVSILVVTNISVASQGAYDCVVSGDFDPSLVTQPAGLTIVYVPVFTSQPLSQTVLAGGSASFSCSATGTMGITFTWRKSVVGTLSNNFANATIVPGGTNSNYSTLKLTNLDPTKDTNVIVTVTNIVGTAVGGAAAGRSFTAILTFLSDTNNDGLPDTFQADHPGVTGAGDEDLDGMSNKDEYFAGTDPFDAASNLKLSASGGGGGALQFSAVSNRTYTVQYTDRLNPAQWKKLTDVLARNVTRTETVADPNSRTNRLYRIVTPIQP